MRSFDQHERLIRAIIAIGSFFSLIVFGFPMVDEIRGLRKERAEFASMHDQFQIAQQRQERLSRIEEALEVQKEDLVGRSMTKADVEGVREHVLTTVRKHAGTLRGLDVNDTGLRPWVVGNDHIHNRNRPGFDDDARYELHTHALRLNVDGGIESLKAIARDILNQTWLVNLDDFEIVPLDDAGDLLSMKLNVSLFGLTEAEPDVELDDQLAMNP
ncbi:MAG: hypothetical protein AAGD07_11755 [Planctomycetota bacterium]